MVRLNLVLDDHDFRKLEALARADRLRPGQWARAVVVRAVNMQYESASVSPRGIEQSELFKKPKKGSK